MYPTTTAPEIAKAMATSLAYHNAGQKPVQKPELKWFYRAKEEMNRKKRWYNGEFLSLAEGTLYGKPARIFLKNNSGFVQLYIAQQQDNKQWTVSDGLTVGVFTLYWDVSNTFTEQAYIAWRNKAVKKLLG